VDRVAMIDADEEVVLVDCYDRPLGTLAKLEAHRAAVRHRAFSVFVTDSAGNVLLQSRARTKYHSGGLWSNACCGHPRVGEAPAEAARRRLFEEMGVDVPLQPCGILDYTAALPNGWHENEVVHLFTGISDADPAPAAEEVEAWRRLSPDELRQEAARDRDAFTAWFRIYMDRVPHLAFGG
jgi:isopentenyl-diphosphate Delta-isomerase